MGEGKNARDRNVVNCISRSQWTTEIRERERESERLRGERMKHFPHKFNAHYIHINTLTRKRKERKNAPRIVHERMFEPSFSRDCDEKDEYCS